MFANQTRPYDMQTMTIKERIDLGANLAKTQTMVMRAFRMGVDHARPSVVDGMVNDLVLSLTQSNNQQRFQIVDGTELCINLLSDRYRQSASDKSAAEAVTQIERALHGVVTAAIEQVAEYDRLVESLEIAPSVGIELVNFDHDETALASILDGAREKTIFDLQVGMAM